MTNAEKYEEIFGFPPDRGNCPTEDCKLCPVNCSADYGCESVLKWWDEEYKGKWIKVKEERMSIDMSGEIVTRYKCSECGRMIAILPSKLSDYPFCHCGADMRGKEE